MVVLGAAVVVGTAVGVAVGVAVAPGSTGVLDGAGAGVVVGAGVASLADQQSDPFTTAYVPTGSRSNDLGFVRELTLEPGATPDCICC